MASKLLSGYENNDETLLGVLFGHPVDGVKISRTSRTHYVRLWHWHEDRFCFNVCLKSQIENSVPVRLKFNKIHEFWEIFENSVKFSTTLLRCKSLRRITFLRRQIFRFCTALYGGVLLTVTVTLCIRELSFWRLLICFVSKLSNFAFLTPSNLSGNCSNHRKEGKKKPKVLNFKIKFSGHFQNSV